MVPATAKRQRTALAVPKGKAAFSIPSGKIGAQNRQRVPRRFTLPQRLKPTILLKPDEGGRADG
jgi:hypothetical protein